MSALSFKEALNKAMKVIKKYVDIQTGEELGEVTLNRMLEEDLVFDAISIEDGTYLEDENGKLLQI